MADEFQAILERTEANLKVVQKAEGIRLELFCYHCGYFWKSYRGKSPRYCARCHVINFDRPPVHRDARRPGDDPNPRWRQRNRRPPKVEQESAVAEMVDARSLEDRAVEVTGSEALPSPARTPPTVGSNPSGATKLPLYLRAPFTVSPLQPRTGLTPPPRLARAPARPQSELMPEQLSSHPAQETTDGSDK